MGDRLRAVLLAVRLAVRAGGWRVPVVLGCSLALAVQPSANAFALKLVTDGALAGDGTRTVAGVATLAAMIAVMFSAYGVSVPLQTTVTERATRLFEQDVMRLVASIPTLEPYERPDVADRLELVRSNSRSLVGVVWTVISNLSFLTGAATALTLLAAANHLLLLLPLFGIPLFMASARAERLRDAAEERTAEASRRTLHLFRVATTPDYAKELRVFALRDEIASRYDDVSTSVNRTVFIADRRAALLSCAAWLLFSVAWAGGIALVARDAEQGRATPGDVVLTIAVAGLVQGYVSGAVGLIRDLTQTVSTARRYVWLLGFSRAHGTGGQAPPPQELSEGIEFDRVSFAYPGTETEVLHDMTVKLPAGSTVALVGDNGAGKSTALKLLLGLYQPTSGRITIDGTDLKDMDIARWHSGLAGAFQDFARLEFTVRESIGVGDLDHAEDDAEVNRAVEQAGASSLPPLGRQLGRAWEGGADISGGQWQQIAVARGMMRRMPLALVLDEPGASLDPDTEHALFQRYEDAARRRAADVGGITVLVSHRLSTVRMADLILVFHEGRVIEEGSHAELMRRGGRYAELFEIQARAYR